MTHVSPLVRRWLRRALLDWFEVSQRDLPWRQSRDPYRIWVSEVMLQQTQVATVIPYFERFVQAFPSIPSLAAADLQDVLRLWQGLGYYRRARDLHRAAQQLVAEHAGTFPDDPDCVAKLPGIGRYTLGAILSQAFDRRLPILETNSRRVLCRVLGLREAKEVSPRHLWEVAQDLLPAKRVGEFNQALMELGALVCTSSRPNCDTCPLRRHCIARNLGLQDEIPLPAPPPEKVEVREAAVVLWRGPRVLLVQRPDEGRWAGMWEFFHGPLETGEDHEEAAKRLVNELSFRAELGPELLTLRHAVTRFHITMVCFEARYRAGRLASHFYRQGRWVRPEELAGYPISSPQRRLIQVMNRPDRQRLLF